jgi:UDP:flavonoid glycosyltransferase YjiC (YdhE family)
MRILISTCPLYGHVNTVLPLALAARSAGHEVVVATGPDLAGHAERAGVEVRSVGDPVPAGTDLSLGWFVESALVRARQLVPLAKRWAPDLVVHEETELAGAVAARSTGARHIVHGLGLMPPVQVWAALAPALDAIGREHAVAGTAAAAREATYLQVCPPALQPPGEAIWAERLPVRPTTGQALPGDRPLADAIARLPYDNTVHLTLGTFLTQQLDILRAALEGLRALPVNVVVTTGPGTDPALLGSQPPQVLVSPYLPHGALLPLCRLVVSHGGAGAMFGALHHGLPQLMLPQSADQFMNAEACVAAGVARSLAPAEVTAGSVAAAVDDLLADRAVRPAATGVRRQIEALPTADEVLARLSGAPVVQNVG